LLLNVVGEEETAVEVANGPESGLCFSSSIVLRFCEAFEEEQFKKAGKETVLAFFLLAVSLSCR
jgi:hypothetical protein